MRRFSLTFPPIQTPKKSQLFKPRMTSRMAGKRGRPAPTRILRIAACLKTEKSFHQTGNITQENQCKSINTNLNRLFKLG